MAGQVRVFIACSLDGFIAGPDGDLSWLPPFRPDQDYGYKTHMESTGAILMGRASYDTVAEFEGDWPYGDTPVLVATSRPLTPKVPTVHAISGDPLDLVAQAQSHAGDLDVYADGGVLIRTLLDAAVIDELVVTIVPVILGAGAPLFAGVARRHELELTGSEAYEDGLVQVRYDVVI